MFNVEKIASVAPREGFEAPINTFDVYRTDNNSWLGRVGRSQTIIQPQEIYNKLSEEFTEEIKFVEFNNGAKCNFRIKLEDMKVKTPKVNDVLNTWYEITIGYDGSTSLTGNLFNRVLRCTNGMVANVSLQKDKYRNTRSVTANFDNMINKISDMYGMRKSLNELFQDLTEVPFVPTVENKDEFIHGLVGLDKASIEKLEEGRTKNTRINKYNAISRSITHEINAVGSSLYGLLNGITWYNQHEVERTDQEHYLRFANGRKMNEKALTMVTDMMYS